MLDTGIDPNLFTVDYVASIPVEKNEATGEFTYQDRKMSVIVRANNREEADEVFEEYAKKIKWVKSRYNAIPLQVISDVKGLSEEPARISKLTFIKMVEKDARSYIPGAWKSIIQTRHTNEMTLTDIPVQPKVIEALMVDFINYVAMNQGVDYAMYTKDLKKEMED